jgi:serine/threonine-protein kinase HipA
LNKGLFADNFKSEEYKKTGHPSKKDFMEFARRIGISENRIEKLLNPFLEKQPFVETLVNRSFLSDATKRGYLLMYNTRRNYLVLAR